MSLSTLLYNDRNGLFHSCIGKGCKDMASSVMEQQESSGLVAQECYVWVSFLISFASGVGSIWNCSAAMP